MNVDPEYLSDFVADVYAFMSSYYLTTRVPHFVVGDVNGGLVCTSLVVGHSFVSTWYRRLAFNLAVRKRREICLIDRLECRPDFSLCFYPVCYSAYKSQVPVGPLYPHRLYPNLRFVVTLQ